MNKSKAKQLLADMIDQAKTYDARGDVTLRNQRMKDMMDLPLPVKYIKAAQRSAGLIR